MLGQLLPCGGGNAIPLWSPKIVVGRGATCDVALPFSSISTEHCALELKEGYWHVTDLNSKNGIRVDGARCKSNRLMPNSVLWVAQHRYQLVYYPENDGPPSTVQAKPEEIAAAKKKPNEPKAPSPEKQPRSPIPRRPQGGSLGVLVPQAGGKPIPLIRSKIVLGRSSTCDVVLGLETVSSKHCELTFYEGYWHVQDLGSRNGIKVQGERCTERRLLPGDVLAITRYRFEIVYAPQGDSPHAEQNKPTVGCPQDEAITRPMETPPQRRPTKEPPNPWTEESSDES